MMKWTTEVPSEPGWYGLYYTLSGKKQEGEMPMVEWMSKEDLEDYREDMGLDEDLEVWFYGPLELEIEEFTGR